jgi:hypothetical protein
MNPNSDLKNNESVVAANAESRISAYAARFAAYSDERLKQTVDHERKVCGSERSYFLAALRGECEKRGHRYLPYNIKYVGS